MVAPDGIRNRPGWLTLSRGNPTGPAQADQTSGGLDSATGLVGKLVCPTLIRERSAKVGRPGRSVAASASALGAEDRRFESCRPDTVIQSTALAPEDHRGNAGVAQWQSPSLPSWPCEFDSRHPLHSEIPSHLVISDANPNKMIDSAYSRSTSPIPVPRAAFCAPYSARLLALLRP
jgi:hypothetical protein